MEIRWKLDKDVHIQDMGYFTDHEVHWEGVKLKCSQDFSGMGSIYIYIHIIAQTWQTRQFDIYAYKIKRTMKYVTQINILWDKFCKAVYLMFKLKY